MTEYKTIKFRVKDKNTSILLDLMSRDVNFVWNVINSAYRKKYRESKHVCYKYEKYITNIIRGSSEHLLLNSDTIESIVSQLDKDVHQFKKQIRYRGKKSQKWIPFRGRTIKLINNSIVYKKMKFRIWQDKKITEKIKSGSFTQDRNKKWFVNLTYEVTEKKQEIKNRSQVGIDLGMKTTATCSNSQVLDLSDLKKIDHQIAVHQKARNFKRVNNLHVKKRNIKHDRINKFALSLVKTNDLIAIGNVSKNFLNSKFSKSRYHNAWSLLKNKIEYKCKEYNSTFLEVDEKFTTQTCNVCGQISGPKGIKELSIRFFICSCEAELNRDMNAAINILNRARSLASQNAETG